MGFGAVSPDPNVAVNSPWPPSTTRNTIKILQNHYGLCFLFLACNMCKKKPCLRIVGFH